MRRSTSGIARRPIGTLSQKIHCQSMPCTIAPPTIGPSATAMPVTALNMPIAVPRFSGGKAAVSSASASGRMNAAPAPCTARAAIRKPTFVLRAHAADASENRPSPNTNVRLRPKRSPSAEAVISSTAKLRLYALTVHSSSPIDARKCRRTVLSAVATTTVSSAAIIDAMPVRRTTHVLLLRVNCVRVGMRSPSVVFLRWRSALPPRSIAGAASARGVEAERRELGPHKRSHLSDAAVQVECEQLEDLQGIGLARPPYVVGAD